MAKKELKYTFEITGDIGYGFGSKEYVAAKLKDNAGKHVDVRVNSLGGSVDDALDIVARMQEHGDVTCYMKGMNASASTILALGAKKICMDKNGLMLIHNCLNVVWELGWMNANEIQEAIERMRKQCEDQQTIDRVIATMYANRCGKTFDQIKEVMDRGGWLTADDCLELGLVDEIIDVDVNDRQMAAVARASFGELQMAYGLPSLPEPTFKDSVHEHLDNIKMNMKNFFSAICALFGMEGIAVDDVNDEQMQNAINDVTAKYNDMKTQLQEANDAKDAATKELDDLKASQEKAVQDAVESAKAEMQQTIDSLEEQMKALKEAPAASPQEPQAGAEPQEVDKQPLEGMSAKEIFNLV